LTVNLGSSVQSKQSESSLQLMLENPKVWEAVEEYINNLSNIIEGKEDVIGYAFVINGTINSADIYGSSALFKKLWLKLLKSSAVEAIINLRKDKEFKLPTAEAVKAFLACDKQGQESERTTSKRTKIVTQEMEGIIRFATQDLEQEVCLHTNYVAKK